MPEQVEPMVQEQAPSSGGGLAISVGGLCKDYLLDGRRIAVFRDANLELSAGDSVAVVGRSGSGKSTLLHLLGLLDRPTSGSILYDARPLLDCREDEVEEFRCRQVGFVFQFHHLLPEFTALENVMMPAVIAGESMNWARARASSLLERVGLVDRVAHAPGELSGGEQQRVAIARALVMSPRVVLADEPTGNLDPATGEQVLDLLLGLNDELGTTLVVATHNQHIAERLPRCLRIAEQRIEEVRP